MKRILFTTILGLAIAAQAGLLAELPIDQTAKARIEAISDEAVASIKAQVLAELDSSRQAAAEEAALVNAARDNQFSVAAAMKDFSRGFSHLGIAVDYSFLMKALLAAHLLARAARFYAPASKLLHSGNLGKVILHFALDNIGKPQPPTT